MSVAAVKGMSARQIAEAELDEQDRKANVARFKEIIGQIKKAKRVVANLERELIDLEQEIDG